MRLLIYLGVKAMMIDVGLIRSHLGRTHLLMIAVAEALETTLCVLVTCCRAHSTVLTIRQAALPRLRGADLVFLNGVVLVSGVWRKRS